MIGFAHDICLRHCPSSVYQTIGQKLWPQMLQSAVPAIPAVCQFLGENLSQGLQQACQTIYEQDSTTILMFSGAAVAAATLISAGTLDIANRIRTQRQPPLPPPPPINTPEDIINHLRSQGFVFETQVVPVTTLAQEHSYMEYVSPTNIVNRLFHTGSRNNNTPQANNTLVNLSPEDPNSLQRIANNSESAMAALSQSEALGMDILRATYEAQFYTRGSADGVNAEILNYLKELYRQNPIVLSNRVLPLEYNRILPEAYQQFYLGNRVHTAYRYLFCKPNPWINRNANFVTVTNNEPYQAHANINPEDHLTILYIWLVLTDPHFVPPQGHTQESLKKLFVETLASLGREHNWDRSYRDANGRSVEYDDLERDRPSCNSGVAKRLAQFLMIVYADRPEFRELSETAIRNIFKEKLIGESATNETTFNRLKNLNLGQLQELKAALDNLVVVNLGDNDGLSDSDQAALQIFQISPASIAQVVADCQTYYGQRFNNGENRVIRFADRTFRRYEDFIDYLGKNVCTVFYENFKDKIDELIRNMPQPINSMSTTESKRFFRKLF